METANGLVWAAFVVVLAAWGFREFMLWARSPTVPAQDIWDMHRRMMLASGQSLPRSPEINKDVILYYALTLEEMAETADALRQALIPQHNERWSRINVMNHLHTCHTTLNTLTVGLKKLLPALADLHQPLPLTEAVNLFDGMMDCTVTIAGMPLAGGFPAAAGYDEVQRSNASKINPATGKIDKDPTGKWIKHRSYVQPQLDLLLHQAWEPDYLPRPEA